MQHVAVEVADDDPFAVRRIARDLRRLWCAFEQYLAHDFAGRRIDHEKDRIFVADGDDGLAVIGDGDAGERLRRLDLAEQLAVRQIDHRYRRIFLIVGIKPLAVRRDGETVTVGRTGVDCVGHLVGLGIDRGHHRTVFAGDVDHAVGAKPQRMRRAKRRQIDALDDFALDEIDDVERVTGIRIAAVNAVAVDRHIGAVGFRDHQQFVHRTLEAVEHGFRHVGLRIEKQDLAADLVDRDHAANVAGVGHVHPGLQRGASAAHDVLR